ncbi:MAG TPA: autotransporter-associated beta strand repeat-containing protein [Tepidisphaeraceae bacterium]
MLRQRRSAARVLLAAAAAMTVGLGGATPFAGAANTPDPVLSGGNDLSSTLSYTSPPGTASDVEFTGTYGNTTFNINGASLNYGTLNDLDTTQALTITNTSGTAGSITLNNASGNSVAPSSSDLLYVASGGNLTLQSGAGTTTLNIGASGNIDNAGTLNLNGPIALGGNTLTFTGAGATTIRGVISGTGGLTLNDPGGSVTLTAANPGNTLTGAVVVNAGTLFVNANANNGNGTLGTTSSITVNSGGTISILDGGQDNGFIGGGGYGGKNITINAGGVLTSVGTRTNHLGTLILAGGTLAESTAVSGAGTAWGVYNLDHGVISGGTSVTSTISAQDVSLTQTGGTIFNVATGTTPSGIDLNVTGSFFRNAHPGDTGLIKTGNGVMALAGANAYTSATTVSAGTLMLDFTQTATAPQNNIVSNASTLVMNGGTLLLNGSTTTADSQQFNGLSVSPGASSIVLTSNGNPILLNVGAMTGNGGTVDFTLPAGVQNTTNGILTTSTPVGGIFSFATVGHISFATVNSFGDIVAATLTSTNVPSEAVIPNAPTANIQIIGGMPGAPTGISGNTTINSLTDNFAGPVIIDPGTSTLTIGTGGVLVGAGAGTLTLGVTPGVGTITAGTGGTSQLVLNNSSGNNLMVNSVVADNGAGVVSLAASGTGSVTLNAANTFSGNASAGAAGLILANPLALQNANYASANIVFSSLVASNAFTAGGLTGNFAFGLTNNAGFPVALTFGGNGQSNSFGGTISGAGSLTKVGSGTETFNSTNTYTGGLIINGGVVASATSGGATSLGAGTVTVNAGGILQGNAQDSFGYTTGQAPSVIFINGGTVQEISTGTGIRQTLPDLTFSNGGTLTGNGNAGDANGNFSFRGNPANGGATDNITVLPSGTTATINATSIWMQATTVNFNVGRGTAPVDLLVNAVLINGGNLTKLGNGIMSLTRQNTFTGLTSVNGGTLMLDFSASGAPSNNILPSGSPVLLGGGTLLLNGGSTAASQSVDGIGFTAGASGITLVSNGNAVMISYGFTERRDVGGTVDYNPPANNTGGNNGIWTFDTPGNTGILGAYATVNGSEWATVFDPNAASSYIIPLPLSAYTLIGSGGTIPDNGNNNIRFTGAGTIGLANGSAGTTNVSTLLLQAGAGNVTIDVGGNGGAAGGGVLNIGADYGGALGGSGGILVQPGAGGLTLGTAPNSGILTGQPGSNGVGELIFINNSANPTLVNSVIANSGGNPTALTKAGSGLLILAGDNTYTGQTTIGAGTLQVGTGGSTGKLGSGAVVDNGALVFNQTANQTVGGAINGSGSLTQNGTGTLTLTTAGNFSGGLTINSGTVISGASGGNAPIGSGLVTVNAGATLQGNTGDAFGYYPNAAPQVININGGTVTEGTGAYRVTLPNLVFSNGGTLSSGGNTGDANGNFSFFGVNGAASITVNASSNTATISAAKIGVQNNLTINVNRGTAATDLAISSVLQNFGTHSITFTGNGITTLSGNNTFSGGLLVKGGTVISTTSGGGTGLGAGQVTVYPGATLLGGNGDSFGFTSGASPSAINIAGGTVSETPGGFRVTLPNINFTNGGTLSSGSNAGATDGSGNYSLFGGTVAVNPAPTPATINAANIALQAGTVTFNVGRGSSPTDLVVSSVLQPFGGGNQGIVKSGTGVMSLTAPNTYTGPTSVNAGVLMANNVTGSATGTGAVTVNPGGMLAGNGIISGATTVNAGGMISAGDGYIHPGRLALTGAATMASGNGTVGDPGNGATYVWKMSNATGAAGNSSGWDSLALNTLAMSGSGSFITIQPISVGGGFLNTPAANFVPSQTYQWTIATLSGGGGGAALAAQFHLDTNALSTFAAANNTSPNFFAVTSDPGDVYISYNPAPEPTSLGLVGLGAGGLLLRRRRNRRA